MIDEKDIHNAIAQLKREAYAAGAAEATKRMQQEAGERMKSADDAVRRAQAEADAAVDALAKGLQLGMCGACKDWDARSHGMGVCKSFDRSYDAGSLGSEIGTRRSFGCIHFKPRVQPKPPERIKKNTTTKR